jgi:hypothetical protein
MHLLCIAAWQHTEEASASRTAMKIHHTRIYWVLVALALIAFLLTLSNAHGQNTGAAAVFEGRPALAGAQAGQGAQAGPPQGGIGVQGSETAERGVRLHKPSGLEDMPQGKRDDGSLDLAAAAERDVRARNDVKPARDSSLAKDERSSVKKSKRAAKRSISRARHGVGEIDSTAATKAR